MENKVKRPDLSQRNRDNAIHNMYNSRTYNTWRSMKQRCLNKDSKDFANYGARGISICERWLDFTKFLEDMGEKPDGMSLDRIDVNGNYEKSNCRWATNNIQGNNRRTCVYVTFNGVTQSVADWSREVGLERKTLEYRIRSGWDVEKALTTPSTIKRK